MNATFIVGLVLAAFICGGDSRVICYWGVWSNDWSGNGEYDANNIDPLLCTHLIYSFVGITANGDVEMLQEEFDIGGDGFADFISLKTQNPDLIVMAAIGGWDQGSSNFSAVASDPEIRSQFVENLVTFVTLHGFDGIDINWGYPGHRGGLETDKDNFVLLCQELREVFDLQGWLLSASVPSTEAIFSIAYDVPAINGLLDFINLMTYDFHGDWELITGVCAPLYAQLTDDSDTLLSVNASANAWINAGASPDMLNLGLALYGQTFTLSDVTQRGTGAPATAVGVAGSYSGETGFWAFHELLEEFEDDSENWDVTEVEGNYAYASRDDFWIGYDTVNTIYAKGQFARDLNLGGIMFWSINYDDFRGVSGTPYPLINAAIQGFDGF